jgi:hypothetical protein
MFKTAVDVSVLMVLPSVFLPNALEACDYKPLPPGVIALGVTKVAFDICPKLVDTSMDGKNDGTANLYSGFWWEKTVPERSQYSDNPDGSLSISFNASLATVPRTMVPGALPLLAGDRRFFVEFEVSISDNYQDHFPAVWIMPIEHNQRQEDSYQPDEAGYERWLEIDVDEAGSTPGPMATAISWFGKWPNYHRLRSNPNLHNEKIDRTQRHRFGAGFDPQNLTISFWYDDNLQYVASGRSVPAVARKQHFYALIDTWSHGLNVPYTMNVYRIRALVP